MKSGRAVTQVVMKAVVIRADGTKEDLGVIQYWHKNPLRRVLFQLFKKWKELF